MILLDLSPILLASLMVHLQQGASPTEVDLPLFRHMALDSIRANRKKFHQDFGELVIAADSSSNWRRREFPYYKIRRGKARKESALDWGQVFAHMSTIKGELRESFPYRVVEAEGAEADDVIAYLARQSADRMERTVIVSGDHDFAQLLHHHEIVQWNPVAKKWVQPTTKDGKNDARQFLLEHIARGDPGDDVPNVMMPDDTFATGQKQKPITAKRLAYFTGTDPEEFEDPEHRRNWARNRLLVDLSQTPDDVTRRIHESYSEQEGKTRRHIFNYFIKNRLKNLMESVNDF